MIDFKDLQKRTIPHVEALLSSLNIEFKQVGKKFQYINPLRDDTNFGSASINIETGFFKDFADDSKGGDLITFVANINKTSPAQAAEYLELFLLKNEGQSSNQANLMDSSNINESLKLRVKATLSSDAKTTKLICPIPANAPPLKTVFNGLGAPTRHHTYHDEDGSVVCHVFGFVKADGSKVFIPQTLHSNASGQLFWRDEGLPAPRPLFNLHLLKLRPDAPVLIVEGEKSADAASKLFPDHVVSTTMGGSPAPDKSDLTPLKGRIVLIWADNDEPGQRYAQKVVKLLRSQDAEANVNIMLPITYTVAYDLSKNPMIEPGFIPSKGYDAADALDQGWTSDHIKLLPTDLYVKSEPLVLDYMVGNFRISDAGVESIRLNKDGDSYETWICSKLEVKALSRDLHSNDWGIVLEFEDKDNHLHKWCMPKSMLVDDRGYRSELLRMGLDIASGDGSQLSSYLQQCNPSQRVLAVSQPGWHKNLYVLPNRIFGGDPESVMIQTSDPKGTDIFQQQGDLVDWQEHVGKYCIGNSRMILSVCAGLSGPWLKVLAEESGGIHFVGESSSGKTTAVQVAASLWGTPDFVASWRTTDNALESIAASRNDNLLILDEMSQVGPEKAGEIAYMLGNGQGKSRATRSAEIQKGKSWRLVYLSTGEVSLADHMGTANKRTMAGQEVRLVNLLSDAGQNMGLFENIHSADNPQAFSQLMKNHTAEFYGSAGIAMLEALVSHDANVLRAEIKAKIHWFINTYVPVGANGQVLRIAQRFGLFAAIGEFAICQKILPWEAGEANTGVSKCFTSWLLQRGGIGAQENEVAISQVRRFIEMNGDARFTNWMHGFETNIDRPTTNRAGFRRQTDDGRTEYIIFPEVWKTEVCSGLSPTQVTKSMSEAGLLEMNNGSATHSMRLPGLGSTKRVYVVKADIMGSTVE